jgi:hypothetical protein
LRPFRTSLIKNNNPFIQDSTSTQG